MYTNIDVKLDGKTAFLTITRESNLNALNRETLQEIHTAFESFRANDQVRGIVVTGAGTKAFAAGADIKEFMDYTAEEGKTLSKWGHDIMGAISGFPKPVIAAINGFALGGGLELALACHIRIASDNAKMGLPEVSLGIIPGYGGTQRLAQLVGRGKALEMIVTGEMISAVEAQEWRLVNHVTAQEDLINKAKAILEKSYEKSAHAIAHAIKAVNAGDDKKQNGYGVEVDLFGACFGTVDFKEGVDAFLNKRKPNF